LGEQKEKKNDGGWEDEERGVARLCPAQAGRRSREKIGRNPAEGREVNCGVDLLKRFIPGEGFRKEENAAPCWRLPVKARQKKKKGRARRRGWGAANGHDPRRSFKQTGGRGELSQKST